MGALNKVSSNTANSFSVEVPDDFDKSLFTSLQKNVQKAVTIYCKSAASTQLIEKADLLAKLIVEESVADPDFIDERVQRARAINEILSMGSWLTAHDINQKQHEAPKNPSQPASDWKRRGKIFGVKKQDNKEYFPAYQFDLYYKPLPIIKQVLETFKPNTSPWVIAAWFHYPNAWLTHNGQALSPKDALTNRPDDVLNAAHKRTESYVA